MSYRIFRRRSSDNYQLEDESILAVDELLILD